MVKPKSAILMIIATWPLALATAQVHNDKCFNVGDTVTIRGHADAGINGGTYFVPLEAFCVHFPKKTDRFALNSLTTVGNKLPPGIYVEVTGELRDLHPNGIFGIGITTTKVRDVDTEVKASLNEIKRRCEQWQTENSAELVQRTHGGTVVREPQNLRGDDYAHNCAIWAVDTALPHELVTVRRPMR